MVRRLGSRLDQERIDSQIRFVLLRFLTHPLALLCAGRTNANRLEQFKLPTPKPEPKEEPKK